MNYKNNPELQERLAAEYALGTLRGRARQRFRGWVREDHALASVAAAWETRLAPLGAAVREVRPPARLWREIEARIGAPRSGGAGWWRALALVASGATAALVAIALITPQAPAPAPGPTAEAAPGYVAVLSDPKSQKAVLLVMAGRDEQRLWLRTLDPGIQVAQRSLELWAVPKGGAPKSLGLVARAERSTLPLRASAGQSLDDVPLLAVSLEPEGGSRTGAPTGPVLYTGPCVKNW